MGITVYWDEGDASVIHFDVEGDWSWGEFYEATQQVQVMTRLSTTELALLVDAEHSRSVGTDAAAYLQNWIALWPKTITYTVVISNQPMVAAVVTLLGRLNTRCRRTLVVGNMESARRALDERRPDEE